MKEKLCYIAGLLVIICGLSACGDWKPEVSGSVVTGSAVATGSAAADQGKKVKPVKEPTLAEVEKAYHFVIGQEVYLYDGNTRDGFTEKELTLYKKEEKDKITYFLVDCTDKMYDANVLIFNKACEEPGFESFLVEDFFDSEKEKKKRLKGAEKLGTVDAWHLSNEKPEYKEPTIVTKKIIKRLEDKITEDVKEHLVRSEAVTYHAYIQYFTAADKSALVYLSKEGEKKAYMLWYSLGEDIQLDQGEYDSIEGIWQESEKTEERELFSRFKEGAMAVSDIYAPATQIADLGLSGDEIEQLKTINTHRKTWIKSVDPDPEMDGYQGKQFMVSDLNQDGKLEVVSILPYGSGGFMCTAVFEVSEDGRSLVKYRNDEENPMEIGDPGILETECYIDKKTGIYYYASENYTNVDGYTCGFEPGRFYLKDHAYKEDYMKACREVSKSDDKITYYKGEKKISKSEYDNVWKAFWQGMEKKKATLYLRLADDLQNMSDADALLSLAKSWKGFAINDSEK